MDIHFKQVMLPVDFSEHGEKAASYAAWFAKSNGGVVHLVHVIANPFDEIYVPDEAPQWTMTKHAELKARELLEAAARQNLPADCARQLHVAMGDPYEKLMEVAKSIAADVIVLSTHGRGGIAHLVIGSVAEKIVRHSDCPVFVVRRAE